MGKHIDLHLQRLRCPMKHNIGLDCRKPKGHTPDAHEATCIVQWQRSDGEIRLVPGKITEPASS